MGFAGLNRPPVPPRYRAVVLGENGEVLAVVRIQTEADADALSRAKALVDGHTVELWDGVRFIEQFRPSGILG